MRQLALLLALAAHLIAPAASRPNLLVITTDDQRPDTIAALGNKVILTPNLDTLVRQGVSFTRAANQGANNGAVCIPSRAMINSGAHLWKVNEQLKGVVTLGGFFRSHGYDTFATGKWHNGNASAVASFETAKNVTPGFLARGQSSEFATFDIAGGASVAGKNTAKRHSTELIGETAVEFLRSRKGQAKPFLAYVAFNAPHDPFETPAAWSRPYRDASGKSTVPLPGNYLPSPALNEGVHKIRDEVLLPTPRTEEAIREDLAVYYGMITQVDAQVGRMLKTLKESGLEEETIIVFTSDHGLARGSHGLLGKQNAYEHSLGVPLIIRVPGQKPGLNTAFTFHQDIFPTLADYAGLKAELPAGQVDGKSLRPTLEGNGPAPRQRAYHGYTRSHRALREGTWKLIEIEVAGKRTTLLFDLANDPGETRNLATQPDQAARLKAMRQSMEEERVAHGDPGLGK